MLKPGEFHNLICLICFSFRRPSPHPPIAMPAWPRQDTPVHCAQGRHKPLCCSRERDGNDHFVKTILYGNMFWEIFWESSGKSSGKLDDDTQPSVGPLKENLVISLIRVGNRSCLSGIWLPGRALVYHKNPNRKRI